MAEIETLTVTVPAALARELDLASEDFFVQVLERGLRDLKIERALEHYAQGGMSFVLPPSRQVSRNLNWPVTLMPAAWNRQQAPKPWRRN